MALQRCPGTPIGLGIPQAKCLPQEPMCLHLPPLDFSFHLLSGSYPPQPQSYLRTLKIVSLCHAGHLGPYSMVEYGSDWGWTVLSKPPQTASWPSLCSWTEQQYLSGLSPLFQTLAILPVCGPLCEPRKVSALTCCM
uniref:Uncharacterized protein n=1 Tax=Mus musculus TaxID=10090 RepID=Q8BQ98_MOUSE|nr:unnamed protein product [Mus musculus]